MRISLARLMGRTMTFGGTLANGPGPARPRRARGVRLYLTLIAGVLAIVAGSVGIVYYMLRPATLRIAVGPAVSDDMKVINALSLRNQVEGGAIQGIGFALPEDFIYDAATGIPVASNLDDYKMQMITTMPKVQAIFIESNDVVGPFGAKGIGEPAFMPPAAAIANAIYHAAGIRLKSLPMNPKKVLEALKNA